MVSDYRLLIIEDDDSIQHTLKLLLEEQGYKVFCANNARVGLSLAKSNNPDLILLDLGLPDIDGITLLEQEEISSYAPVIVLTARWQDQDKVHALDAVAEDYIVKPFSTIELFARIRAVLRRNNMVLELVPSKELRIGNLVVNQESRTVLLGKDELHLTPYEYKLLLVFIENQGKALTHRFIQHEVWGYPSTDEYKTLRVLVASLRRKLQDNHSHPEFIKTEVGVGYRFIGE